LEKRKIEVKKYTSFLNSQFDKKGKKLKFEDWKLGEILCIDVETGRKILVYGNEIKGKNSIEKIENIARKKIEKEILKEKGLYEEIKVNIDETPETLFPIEEDLIFTDEDIENITSEIVKNNEILKKYEDLEESFKYCFDDFEYTEKYKSFFAVYCEYKYILNSNDFFEEEDLEKVSFEKNSSFLNEKYKNSVEEKFKSLMKTIQETECLNQIQIEDFENDFYIDLEELQETRNLTKLEKKEQIERRVNECKPLADIMFKYLVGLKNRITGVRKTEKEMTEKYGEFDEFFMERRKV
jgi:hypothetical protein